MYSYLKSVVDIPIEVLFHTKKTHGITDEIISQIDNDSFIIIPDASVNTLEMAKKLKDKNVKCLVLDHHELRVDAPNIITVNNQYGNVQNKALSGAGVTHKFCQYVDEVNGTNYAEQMYDLVALSIVSDVCSALNYENRVYMHKGFNNITNPFFKYMCESLIRDGEVTPVNLSFNVINILNSVCRSDNQELKRAVFRCFVGEDDDYSAVVSACKKEKRQQDDGVKAIIEDSEIVESKNLVVMFTEENNGTSGLIANKLQSAYLKPSFVVHESDGKYFGSCRSPVEIRSQLEKTKLFSICKGHSCAFGIGIDSIENLNKIQHYLDKLDLSQCSEYKVIATIKPSELSEKLCNLSHNYKELWDNDLPQPTVHCKIRCKGSDWVEMKGATIKYVDGGVSCIKFFTSNKQKEALHIGEDREYIYDIIAKPDWNIWNGNKYRQLVITTIEVGETKKVEFDDLW